MIAIAGVMPTLEEAQELYSDLRFVQYGKRPSRRWLSGPMGQSTWYLRSMSEEIMALLVKEFRDDA